MTPQLRVESTRGDWVESVHQVSVAVVDSQGRLVASAGDPDMATFWRSAAKPFQAMPMVADGAADRFGFSPRELALACASHSSEPAHLEIAESMLKKVGLTERALACGPHPPLSPAVAESVLRQGIVMTPRWSNCSGKHAAMLAMVLHHGWPVAGYERREHPLQQRVLAEVVRWSGCAEESLHFGVDGCTVVCFGLPLRAMALAYARFATSEEPAAVRLRESMAAFPGLIAGQGRLETELGLATAGLAIAKVGADGIYCAALPHAELGIALKVHDGDMRSSGPLLLAVLRALGTRFDLGFDAEKLPPEVTRHGELPTLNTRGAVTGVTRVQGALQF